MKSSILVACFSKNNGGMELNAMGIAKLLSKAAPVYMVCRKNSYIETCKDDLKKNGVELITINFKTNFSLKCISEVKNILVSHKIKNLIFFGASELKSLVISCRGLNINFINFHGTTKTHSKIDFFHKFLYKTVTHHVAISEHIKKNVLSIIPLTTDQSVKVIYLPYEKKFEMTKHYSKPLQIINVSRITYGKGHEDCLNVFERLRQDGIAAHLTFVGGAEDQTLFHNLKKQIIKSKDLIGNVTFTGFTKNVAEFLDKSQIMLFPSQGEGLSNSIIEAFFHKVLPISYSNTAFPEYLRLGFEFPQAQHNNKEELYILTKEVTNLSESEFQQKVNANYRLAEKYFSNSEILGQYSKLLV